MALQERIKKYPEETLLLFILFAGAILRLHHLGFTSLSNDELSAITRAHQNSFSELIRYGVMPDFHPAGVEVFMYNWIKLFGDGVFAVRFPFAIAGIISILVVYLVAERWFSKTTALFSASALCFLQYPLLYSQIARPYSFGLLFILTAAYFWTRILFPKENELNNRRKNIWLHIGFIISMSACMHTHYFAFMLAGIIGVSGLFFLNKENSRRYIISGIIILLLFIPEIPVFRHQMSIGGLSEWLEKPGKNFFRSFIDYCFNDSTLLFYLFTGVCIASFVYFRKQIEITKFHWLSLAWFLLPFFIGYYYSILRNPVLQYSTLLFGFPFLVIFIFSFIQPYAFSKDIVLTVVVFFTLIGSFNTVKMKHYYGTHHFGVFKELADDATKWSDTYGENKMARVMNVISPEYIGYYFDKMNRKMKIDLYRTDDQAALGKLMTLADTTSATYFLYAWSNVANPPEAEQIITAKFPSIVDRDTFFNSQITLYKRDPDAVVIRSNFNYMTDFENDNWENESKIRSDELAHSGKFSEKMDDKKEYSVNYTKRLSDFSSIHNGIVTASVWINSKDAANDGKLVLSFENNGKAFEWYSADIKSFNQRPGEWQQVLITRPLPKPKSPDDVIKAYIWNPGKKVFYIDDFKVTVTEKKE
jgi:hypothetical protein